jgi:hypothetical protein
MCRGRAAGPKRELSLAQKREGRCDQDCIWEAPTCAAGSKPSVTLTRWLPHCGGARQTVAGGADFAACIENIDIGGPTMLRAAAKNHQHVLVVVDPADYPIALAVLKGEQSPEQAMATRKRLAWKAFQHCASYDSQVAEWLWGAGGAGEKGAFPPEMSVPMTLMNTLRYGENSHQQAAVYSDGSLAELAGTGVAAATLHWGKEVGTCVNTLRIERASSYSESQLPPPLQMTLQVAFEVAT